MYVRVYVSTLSLSINTQKRTWPISGHLTSRLVSNAYFHLWTLLFPEGLKNMFKPTSRVHSYSVRGSSNNVFVSRPCIRKQLRGRLAIRAAATGGYSVSNAVADPVLQIRGEEGGGLFRLFGPQFGLKIRGGEAPPGPSPGSATVNFLKSALTSSWTEVEGFAIVLIQLWLEWNLP